MKLTGRFAFALIAASLNLAACGTAGTTVLTPLPNIPSASATRPPASPSPLSPSPMVTVTSNPCLTLSIDYCILEAFFIFHPPIASPGIDTVDRSYPYGSTENGRRIAHHGVEFYNGSGTPVLAALDGSVYYAGDDTDRKFSPSSGFYGKIVVIEHSLTNT